MDTSYETKEGVTFEVNDHHRLVSEFEMNTNIWKLQDLEHRVLSGKLDVESYYLGYRLAHLIAFEVWLFLVENFNHTDEYFIEKMDDLRVEFCPECRILEPVLKKIP